MNSCSQQQYDPRSRPTSVRGKLLLKKTLLRTTNFYLIFPSYFYFKAATTGMASQGSQIEGLKWIKIYHPSCNSNPPQYRWEPVLVIRQCNPHHTECQNYIVKTVNNKYRTFHFNDLYDSIDSEQYTPSMISSLNHTLQRLLSQTTVCCIDTIYALNILSPLNRYQSLCRSMKMEKLRYFSFQNQLNPNRCYLDSISFPLRHQ